MSIKPEMYQWACNRGPVDMRKLHKRFPMYDDWKNGIKEPTLKQLEAFAKFTHAPVGAMFLSEPMEEELPIKDLRTMSDHKISKPSGNLLDTIYMCERRQDWYHTFAIEEGEMPLSFIGSATVESDVQNVAEEISNLFNFSVDKRKELSNWSDSLRYFASQADDLGILVMISGVVDNNPHRKLDPQEFRGFALADDYAPLIFINGADSKAAQIFTLAHELAHLWLGQSNLSNASPNFFPTQKIEKWCNQVAAELIVPTPSLQSTFQTNENLSRELQCMAHQYKVSTLVILRKLYDIRIIDQEVFKQQYLTELRRLKPRPTNSGGNFYSTLKVRVGARFGEAIVGSTLSNETSYTDALRYLGIKKVSTLKTFATTLWEIK